MQIRQDVADMLRAGYSDRDVATQLNVCAKTVAAARRLLNLPKVKPGPTVGTLETALQARSVAVDGGHRVWTGHTNSTGVPCFRWNHRMWTAYRAAFQVRYGRAPVGKVTPGCGMPHCVAPDHVEDRPMRDALNSQYDAIFGGSQ